MGATATRTSERKKSRRQFRTGKGFYQRRVFTLARERLEGHPGTVRRPPSCRSSDGGRRGARRSEERGRLR
jgi:hypothetical protein